MQVLISAMIYLGSALMVCNIWRYFRFTKQMNWMERSARSRLALYTPLVLLILFLIGYLAVVFFGAPDFTIAAILLGGSIFVLIVLGILYYIVACVRENERELSEVQAASSAKTAFLSNMSHDIRTPMNAIIGYTRLALREGTDAGEMRGYLEKIRASSRHLLALIDDVLEMSRIESGRLELRPSCTDLRAVIRETGDLFEAQMQEKGLSFTASCGEIADPVVLCDRERLDRVLLNLLSNACKFTPSGGSVSLLLRQTGRQGDAAAYELTVSDTGIGMSPEFAARVFEAFERERTSTVSGIQGTGLGMAITKSIVGLMGGEIAVKTAQGAGTTFTVSLRLPVTGPEAAAAAETGAQESLPRLEGMRVLLAEDNPVNREIAALLLGEMGFAVDPAENGRIAVEKLAAAAPDAYRAVLMDVQMPEMNGLDATRAIRALPDRQKAAIPVIAMTANAFAEDIAAEQEAGMNGHISKPLQTDEVVAVLLKILRPKE